MSAHDKQRIDQIISKWTLRHGLKINRDALDDIVNRLAHGHKRSKGCAVAAARREAIKEYGK